MPARRGNATVQLDARTFPASPLATAITTVLLIAAGCLLMGVATLIHAPAWAAIGSVLVPAGIFMVIRFMPGKNSKNK